ncbi:MAG: preprotein translocase subunit SecE [Clostridia bacterium]|nr:preprotein translocase subunit SecE [Clostridia bacterium]
MAKKDKKEMKNNKDKKSFTKSFKAELKKVIWPTPKQLFNNTVAVLAIVLVTTAIVFVLDLAFESMNKYGIDKVKEIVSNSTTNEQVEDAIVENETTEDGSTEDGTTEVEVTDENAVTDETSVESNEVVENVNNAE